MSELKDRLKNDLTTAIKARDKVRTATLRMVLAAISTEESSGSSQRSLGDEEIVRLLTREAKKRREAAEAFDKGGRPEQAEAERAESEVISDYLPKQLTDEELTRLVAEAVVETGVDSPKAMGQVMKALNPRVAGRAEGSRVAAEVKRQLSGRL
ncbi:MULTISPECIES: GatB/YqeY domain-containing protein [unclassified Nocardiopsis]|uniref:GatB/YqeY domain-containing protein n=1 Tax=unclassified Nocardiopsis TaxID=2649073 RepID=UPI00135B9899|nr:MULTISPECIES: GatB/YqeY domain-containing protein [unclassified Nocardiopsis]